MSTPDIDMSTVTDQRGPSRGWTPKTMHETRTDGPPAIGLPLEVTAAAVRPEWTALRV